MEISIKKTEKNYQFYANNGEVDIPICASPSMEEGLIGFRPMQLILVSLGGCMSIDVMNILLKQRQQIDAYEVKVKADRVDEIPAIFKSIIIEIHISGKVKEKKLQEAIQLSEEKYCSVHKILGYTAEITTKYFLNHE